MVPKQSRVVVDMMVLALSDLFVGHPCSSFSANVLYLRQAMGPPWSQRNASLLEVYQNAHRDDGGGTCYPGIPQCHSANLNPALLD